MTRPCDLLGFPFLHFLYRSLITGYMKIVFYKALFSHDLGITPCEKIIYSFLVSKTIQSLEEIHEKDGKQLNMLELDYQLESNAYVHKYHISNKKLMQELSMSEPTIVNGLKHLKERGLADKYIIHIPTWITENGYFELIHEEILCGELLIFYSYLVDFVKRKGNYIRMKKEVMQRYIGKSPVAITKMLYRLYELKLAKRMNDGSLFIETKN